MKTHIAAFLFTLLTAIAAPAQTALTNQDVIKLKKADFKDDFILSLIDQRGASLSSDIPSLVELKQAGISERIITAITQKSPSREAINSESIIRLSRAGFSENFILDVLERQPAKFSMDANRIVELKQAGVGERVLAKMVGQSGERTLSASTEISVRLIDSIDSKRDNPGHEFRATLQDPIRIGDTEVVPQGADATVRLAEEKESGKLTGKTELRVELVSFQLAGKTILVNTSTVSEYSGSRGARTAKSAAAVGAVGAIIGAIAGGGKGAAIGAGAGAAAGAGAQVFMKGQRVYIPSETLLSFTTQNPVPLP